MLVSRQDDEHRILKNYLGEVIMTTLGAGIVVDKKPVREDVFVLVLRGRTLDSWDVGLLGSGASYL